jgi:hypothetical protein
LTLVNLLTGVLGTFRNKDQLRGHCKSPGGIWQCSDQCSSCRGAEKWLDLEYILKVEPTGFPAGLDVGCERKRSQG